MLLSSLIDTLHLDYNQLQAQIDALQAKQRQVLEEIQSAGVRESRMESCLALLQEVIRESQGHPEELEIFKSAVDAAFSGEVVALLPSVDEPAGEEKDVPNEPAPISSEEEGIVEGQDLDPLQVEIVDDSQSDIGLEEPEKATMKQLNSLHIAKLRKLARGHKLTSTGTAPMLVQRLWGTVTVEEFIKVSA